MDKTDPRKHFFVGILGDVCEFCKCSQHDHVRLPGFDGSVDLSAQIILENLRPFWVRNNVGGFVWPPVQNYYEHYSLWAGLVKPRRILEIGCMYGWSIMAMLMGWPHVESVHLIDSELYGIPMDDTAHNITEFCASMGFVPPSIVLHKMNTTQVQNLNDVKKQIGYADLVHIDGEHSKNAVRNDIRITAPILSDQGTMIIDDIKLPGIREGADEALRSLPGLTYREVKSTQDHYLIWRR